MSIVLITGTSGFIGQHLANSMAKSHAVICISRQQTPVESVTAVQGDFSLPSELQRIPERPIDVLVHLAAVTGGGTEAEQLRVNVLGTHHLVQYCLERGCKKFVLASSIAAVGFQSPLFRPLQLPMPDEHPCLDRVGYGFSKYIMEELTRYLARQNEALDFINIRLASIAPDDRVLTPRTAGPCRRMVNGFNFIHVPQRRCPLFHHGGRIGTQTRCSHHERRRHTSLRRRHRPRNHPRMVRQRCRQYRPLPLRASGPRTRPRI